MFLEKDKVYKVRHNTFTNPIGWVNYIIFSPIYNVIIPDDFFDKTVYKSAIRDISTHFTVCFDKNIITKYDGGIKKSVTGLRHDCEILDITNEDYPLIKEAMEKLGHGYKYNRKLNKLIQTA